MGRGNEQFPFSLDSYFNRIVMVIYKIRFVVTIIVSIQKEKKTNILGNVL